MADSLKYSFLETFMERFDLIMPEFDDRDFNIGTFVTLGQDIIDILEQEYHLNDRPTEVNSTRFQEDVQALIKVCLTQADDFDDNKLKYPDFAEQLAAFLDAGMEVLDSGDQQRKLYIEPMIKAAYACVNSPDVSDDNKKRLAQALRTVVNVEMQYKKDQYEERRRADTATQHIESIRQLLKEEQSPLKQEVANQTRFDMDKNVEHRLQNLTMVRRDEQGKGTLRLRRRFYKLMGVKGGQDKNELLALKEDIKNKLIETDTVLEDLKTGLDKPKIYSEDEKERAYIVRAIEHELRDIRKMSDKIDRCMDNPPEPKQRARYTAIYAFLKLLKIGKSPVKKTQEAVEGVRERAKTVGRTVSQMWQKHSDNTRPRSASEPPPKVDPPEKKP